MIEEREYTDIVVERRNDALWIGINRGEVRNAFREQTLDSTAEALNSTREDPTIVAAVIYGVGGHFSAGGDFHAMMKLNKANSYMWNDRMMKVAMTCRNLPIPVIAMVEGACVGGGHELMLWCDLVIASEDSIFGQTGARVGACPTVGATQYIGMLIGERRAKEMIFLCKRYSGKEAAEIGLANISVPAAELLTKTEEVVADIKGYSSQTIRATKVSLNFGSDMLYASWQHGMELLANIWGTEEADEGMTAFLEGRKADFHQFRERNKAELDQYMHTYTEGHNQSDKSRAARAVEAG
ncbi:MAG: enoyl-CoA hydratase/isomerase family protein [Acidimicrobiia bacterium]|nr:enoyl-CoA hydratase/isomerase family protein [Acidimicrobiia bacterium]